MSHFTVMVIGENPEEQLNPFQENNMGDCPQEFMEFFDETEEINKKWAEEDPETKKQYSSIEEYVEDCFGYKLNEETGKYGYWENPNAKWDWYTLGGRWTGTLKLKKDTKHHVLGSPSLLMPTVVEEGYADQALKSEIDFEGMRNEAAQKAANHYEKVYNIIKDYIDDFKTFDQLKACYPDEPIADIRSKYHDQSLIKAWNVASEKDNDLSWFFEEEIIEKGREDYILDRRNSAGITFALLKDGKWYEKGEMGWWGMVSNKKEEEQWSKEFSKLIDEISDDTLISIYDCHI